MYDYELEKIRRIRQEISNEYNNDLKLLVKYYQKIEQELKDSGEYQFTKSSFTLENSTIHITH